MTAVLLCLAGLAYLAWATRLLFRSLDTKWSGEREQASAMTNRQAAVAEREVAVKERAIALQEKAHERPDGSDAVIPKDLADRVKRWEDGWAQEAEEANIRQLYALHKNWDAVRRNLQPIPLPDNLPGVDVGIIS